MSINRENYEAYFIDYLEGNLDEKLVDDFIEFLQQNSDLKEELALFENISVEPVSDSFGKKETLIKHKLDSEQEFNKAAIALVEDDISEEEKTELNNYLAAHPEKRNELILFQRTRLKADESVKYPQKRGLYKYSAGKTILLWSGRVAAILVLALAFYVLIDRTSTDVVPQEQLAEFEDKKEKKADPLEIKKVPVEPQKEETNTIKKETVKPPVKKVSPEKKPKKSLREDTRGRARHEDLVLNRIPLEVPDQLKSLTASLQIEEHMPTLATMNNTNMNFPLDPDDEKLLADVVKEKTGLGKFKFSSITKAGLNLVSNFTKNNFSYETNNEGKVTELNYDSRLLAFSIPANEQNSGD